MKLQLRNNISNYQHRNYVKFNMGISIMINRIAHVSLSLSIQLTLIKKKVGNKQT